MDSRPFLFRLLLPFAIMIMLIVGVCGAIIYLAGERSTRDLQVRNLERLTPMARQWVGDGRTLDEAQITNLREAARVIGARLTLIGGDGNVLFDTHAKPSEMANHNSRAEVIAARQGRPAVSVRDSGTIHAPSVYVAALLDPSKPDGIVVRLSDTQHAWAGLGGATWPVVAGSVAAALATCALLWITLQMQWIGPTQRLAEAADRMAAGDWHWRVDPRGAFELRAFSARLNLVASHALKQLQDLQHQRADLAALVDTLPDPILVSDAAGKVVLINAPAARLLDVTRAGAIGQPVVNVVNDEAVLQLFDQTHAARASPGDEDHAPSTPTDLRPRRMTAAPLAPAPSAAAVATRDVRLNRRGHWLTFHGVATATTDGGVLVVLRDMTAATAAVQMKTDFVANASHELRTPIAAIKIAFETFREVDADDVPQAERCLQIIEGHLRRLEEMLRDLLDLSRVENANLKPHVRRVRSAEVFAQIRGALSSMARQKGVDLHLGRGSGQQRGEGLFEPESFLSDERLLNLLLKNLVENSIKFTPSGGSVSVCVSEGALELPSDGSGESGPSPVTVSVIDTGIGIPPEHLDRIFERFYQVDPARSGSAGRGTGLGLAIVKHAIAGLGGTIGVQSEVGRGTIVTCLLPQTPAPLENAAEEADALF